MAKKNRQLSDMPETVQEPLPALAPAVAGRVETESQPRRRVLIGVMVLLALVAMAVFVPGVRWRLQIVYLDLMGRIPDLEFRDLPSLLMPGSGQAKIARLVITRNPYATIHVPSTAPEEVDRKSVV